MNEWHHEHVWRAPSRMVRPPVPRKVLEIYVPLVACLTPIQSSRHHPMVEIVIDV